MTSSSLLQSLSIEAEVYPYFIKLVCLFLIQTYVFLAVTTVREPNLRRSQVEKEFHDPKTERSCPFPHLTDPPSVYLSVIVPSYKEGERRE